MLSDSSNNVIVINRTKASPVKKERAKIGTKAKDFIKVKCTQNITMYMYISYHSHYLVHVACTL